MATSSSYDWDDDDSSPGTSRGRRPPSAVAREKEKVIAEKTKQLPEDFQFMFHRMMTSLYNQESSTMVSFLDDARQSLASIFDDFQDEQQVLSLTSKKITCSRPTTAVSQGRAAESQQQQQQLQSSAGRHGVIAARAQRIASAKQNTKQPRQPSLTSGNAPLAAAGLEAAGLTPRPQTGRARPMTAASSPQPTLNGNRPSTSSSSRRSTPGSSMDSVTFESELARTAERRASPRTPSTPPTAGVRLMPSVQLPPAEKPAPNATTTVVVVASAEVHNNDTDEEYQEEKEEIMKRMSSAHTQIDRERERQKAILRERQEKKKVRQDENEKTATAMVREATVMEELKQKEKERQEQLIRERLEERKRRKNDLVTAAEVETSRSRSVVVQVAESNDVADTTTAATENKKKAKDKSIRKDTSQSSTEEYELRMV